MRPFGCGWFIREFLLGNGPHGSPVVDSSVGAPQADIYYHYKNALRRATAIDRATRIEEKQARREKRAIDPSRIENLFQHLLNNIPYKANGCRYHSFVTYFSNLQRLGWVALSGIEEPSELQSSYPPAPPRRFFRLTDAGRQASASDWANPLARLYGRPA